MGVLQGFVTLITLGIRGVGDASHSESSDSEFMHVRTNKLSPLNVNKASRHVALEVSQHVCMIDPSCLVTG